VRPVTIDSVEYMMGVCNEDEDDDWETEESGTEEGEEASPPAAAWEQEECIEEGCEVRPGDVLVSGLPFVYAIQPEFRHKVCDRCFAFKDEWQGITLCGDCSTVGYCGEQCRLKDRERHRVECSLVVMRNKRSWPHKVWFLARACIRLGSEGWDQRERINNKKSRAFRDLVDHYNDVTTDPSKETNKWWQKEVAELLGALMPPMEEYLSIYGRLLVNSFALRVDHNGEEENVGTALYRANSIFDHSCRPSATTVFSQGRLQIKAMEATTSLNLGNYFISYMDEAETRAQRQSKLKKTWYFDCLCPACGDLEAEREKHAAICDKENCRGQVTVDLTSWEWNCCKECGEELSQDKKSRYQDTYEMVRQVVDENGGEVQYTDVNEFLVRQMEDTFHPTDLQLMQAALGAAQGCVQEKSWSKAARYLSQSLPGLRKYYHHLSGYLGSNLLHYGEALHWLGRKEEAREVVMEADTILRVIPGIHSYMYSRYYGPRVRHILA